jgi:hypothetical protein
MWEIVRYFLVGGFTFTFAVCIAFLAWDWITTQDMEFDETKRTAEMAELYALRWNQIISTEEYCTRVGILYGLDEEMINGKAEEKEQGNKRRKGSWRIHIDFQAQQNAYRMGREMVYFDA